MGLTRRAALAIGAMTGLAGCQTSGDDSTTDSLGDTATEAAETESTTTDRTAQPTDTQTQVDASDTAQYFNESGELTAPVNNDSVRTSDVSTASVSQNVATGTELVAYWDGETAKVVDGRTREVVYADDDIGDIINGIQEDFPAGVHLHLLDLFEYSTNIVISTPMKLTGERAVTNFSRRGANAVEVDPIGLRFTGDDVAVKCYNGTKGVRGLHVEDLFVHAESGTVAFQVYGRDDGQEYSPWADSIFHNITTEGGSEAGFEMNGNMFNNTIGDIRAFGSGGHGIWIHNSESGGNPGLSTINLLRAKFCDGDGVRLDALHHSSVNRIYENFCKGRGIYLGTDCIDNVYNRIFAEINEGPDVEIKELLRGRIHSVIGKGGEPSPPYIDYSGPSIKVGLFNGRIDNLHAKHGDLVLDGMQAGSSIGQVSTQDGAQLDVADGSIFDSVIEQVLLFDDDQTYRFNEATLTDEQERGNVRFGFDTRFNRPPTLTFGRRGGGIETVELNKTSEDGQYWSADIFLAEPGGTVDVKAHMSRDI